MMQLEGYYGLYCYICVDITSCVTKMQNTSVKLLINHRDTLIVKCLHILIFKAALCCFILLLILFGTVCVPFCSKRTTTKQLF